MPAEARSAAGARPMTPTERASAAKPTNRKTGTFLRTTVEQGLSLGTRIPGLSPNCASSQERPCSAVFCSGVGERATAHAAPGNVGNRIGYGDFLWTAIQCFHSQCGTVNIIHIINAVFPSEVLNKNSYHSRESFSIVSL
jgi:hypothetical protein